MSTVWPLGPDYYYTYYQVSQRWLRGETRLYDEQSRGFYNAPWTLILIVPLSLLRVRVGEAVLNTMSLLGMLATARFFRGSKPTRVFAIILSLANLHAFDLLLRGQIDAFVLMGIGLGWAAIRNKRPLLLSVAFWLISIKPQNALLVIALFLWGIRKWPISDCMKVLSLPLLSFLVSGLIIGFDWPVRYWTSLQTHPPYLYLQTTIWRGASQLGIAVWPLVLAGAVAVAGLIDLARKKGMNEQTLGIALATNIAFTPYALGSHYILLVPALLFLARWSWKAVLLAYLTTWTPLLRLIWGFDITWVDTVYPVTLLLACWLAVLRGPISTETKDVNGNDAARAL